MSEFNYKKLLCIRKKTNDFLETFDEFSTPVKCFQLFGFQKVVLDKYAHLLHVFQIFNVICVIAFALSEAYYIQQNFKDILASAEAFGPLAILIITLVKMVTFFARSENFYDLMNEIKSLSAEPSCPDLKVVRLINQFVSRIGSIYFSSGAITSIGYCATPIISNLFNILFFEAELNYEMPYKLLFPYEITRTPAYELTYALCCWVTCVTFIINLGVDIFFLSSCLNICVHLDFMRDLFDGDKRRFISNHDHILNLIKKLSDVIKPVLFIQFFMTSMLLCVLGFQILVLKDLVKKFIVLSFGIVITIQLFIYAYGGQVIMDKSSSVPDNLYQMDKDFIIIIRRAHKAAIIQAGFYRATLPVFSSTLSSAASLITLLQSSYSL